MTYENDTYQQGVSLEIRTGTLEEIVLCFKYISLFHNIRNGS